MTFYRLDGLGEDYSDDTDIEEIFSKYPNIYFAVKQGDRYFIKKNIFTEKLKNCSVIKELDKSAILFNDKSKEINKYFFYISGLFGIDFSNQYITKIITQHIQTFTENKFKIYYQDELLKLLITESNGDIKLSSMINEIKLVANSIHGKAFKKGLIISPQSVGIII